MERKNKVDILSLKQYQELNIENEKYIVINQIKYIHLFKLAGLWHFKNRD